MRRFKILFIDDEEVIRESFLKLVDWEKYQFDVAGVFKNGEDAWKYLQGNPVDIIITDINMPFMDGISLLEVIRRECPKTRVLLLTGYEYFEYAQKAVQYRAFDFLLKPVTTKRLLQAVMDAAFDIEKEEASEEAVGKSLELSRSNFVCQIFYGKIEKTQIKKTAESLKIPTESRSFLVMLTAVDPTEGKQLPDGELGELKRKLQQSIMRQKEETERECEVKFQLYFARNIGIHIEMLLVSDKGKTFDEHTIRHFMERVVMIEPEAQGYKITPAAGRNHRQLSELSESYEKVKHALKNRHILGVGKGIYDAEPVLEHTTEEEIILPTDTFLKHIRMGLVDEVKQDIRNIYEPYRHRKYISLESARMVTTELAITAFKGETASNDESVSYLYYLNHIQQLHTLKEMEEDITGLAVKITEKRKNGGSHKKKIAEQALEYLRNNYEKENLSLNDVAAHLNISVPYLAVLFKQETEKNFSAHLLEIRMEKAKELLKTTGNTVGEISEKVGYGSSQYFAVCFKKYTGVSPGAYRDKPI